jgi:nicotinamidase/pyrazinamidase
MKVLVLVDMLKGFLEKGNPLYCGDQAREIIPNVVALAEECVTENIPILHVQDSHWVNDYEFGVFEQHCLKGTEEAEIIPELGQLPITAVPKRTIDGFHETQLGKWLRYYGCMADSDAEAIVVGVCTDICIQYVVMGLGIRGIPVTVYEDCVATFNKHAQESALVHMQNMLGAKIEKYGE